MSNFKNGDKIRIVKSELESYWYADKIGCVFTLHGERFGDSFAIKEESNKYVSINDISLEEKEEYTAKHYDNYYYLSRKDIEEGKIRVDAYWVAKQWKIGSRDDSGALFHNLKTIARFGEKNSIEREIKALYNQTKALARVYGVELDE